MNMLLMMITILFGVSTNHNFYVFITPISNFMEVLAAPRGITRGFYYFEIDIVHCHWFQFCLSVTLYFLK